MGRYPSVLEPGQTIVDDALDRLPGKRALEAASQCFDGPSEVMALVGSQPEA